MGRGSKFKGPATVGAPAVSTKPNGPAGSNGVDGGRKKYAGISDALRQAVLDLGGGEDDLDLIDGVDEDDDEPAANGEKKEPVSEVRIARVQP